MNRRARLIIAAVTLLGVLAFIGVGLLSTAELLDSGHDLRPYESGTVYKVEVADSIILYADQETSRVRPDLATGLGLTVLATVSVMTATLLRAGGARRRLPFFYLAAGIGFGWLAFDELVAVHETVGHNLPFLADLPGIERPDDLFFGLYVLPVLAFAIYFRDILRESRTAFPYFVAAGVFLLAAGITDIRPIGKADEILEPLAGLAVGIGFLLLVATHLRASFALQWSTNRVTEPIQSEPILHERLDDDSAELAATAHAR